MSNCAILIFAKSTVLESNSKIIVSCAKKNHSLWHLLNSKTIAIARKSKMPFFIVDESIQIGVNFGERISNAAQTIFDKGFTKLIIIGNDCPALSAAHLMLAKSKLQHNDLVFGPDINGGAYLIGISKNEFAFTDFKSFTWQSNQLFKSITTFYDTNQTFILPHLADVNNASSFKSALHKLCFKSKLKYELLRLFVSSLHVINYVDQVFFFIKIASVNYRGPPKTVYNLAF